jgi:hypothetical protein
MLGYIAFRRLRRSGSIQSCALYLPDNDVFYQVRPGQSACAPGLTLHSRCQLAGSIRTGSEKLVFLDREKKGWWSQTGSNRRPHACKARALPTELWPHYPEPLQESCRLIDPLPLEPPGMVGPGRLELPTSRLSGVRSNHLSYGPMAARRPDTDLDITGIRPASLGLAIASPPDLIGRIGDDWKEKRRRRRSAPVVFR